MRNILLSTRHNADRQFEAHDIAADYCNNGIGECIVIISARYHNMRIQMSPSTNGARPTS